MKLSFPARLAWRDWRAGELQLLVVSLLIAVATVTGIGLFVDRLQQALVSESADFLAADLQLRGSRPIPEPVLTAAAELELESARSMLFPSMVFAGTDKTQLASIKAVSAGYPLRGVLRTSQAPFTPGTVTRSLPGRGEVWLDARLFPTLGIALGDEVEVGYARFRVTRVLTAEPDRGGSLFDLGPRLLMHIDDVPATRVVQPGSRISYRLLLRGPASALQALRDAVTAPAGFRWVSIRESSPGIGAALDRAESYLLLGGLLAVLLAAVAVSLCARRYAVRHFDHVAVLKTLGATPNQITAAYGLVLLLVTLTAIAGGLVLGALLHWGIIQVLATALPVVLPAPSLRPAVLGGTTGLVCALAFALPPFLQLRNTSPLRVIRREFDGMPALQTLTYAAALAGVLVLLLWYSGSWWLTLLTLGGVALAMLGFGALALLLLGGSALGMQAGNLWRLALAGLRRRRLENVGQMLVFGLAIMLMLLIILLRTSLLDQWRSQVPEGAPNHFVLNLLPSELDAFQQQLAVEGARSEPFYAMIRGRIQAVNGMPAAAYVAAQDAQQGGVEITSERNLTFARELPPDNEVIEGRWWPENENRPLASLEADYARELGLGVGDRLTFDIAGQQLEVRIANIRRLAWESMRPNFFVIFSPPVLENFSTTFMTSFHLPPERKPFLVELLRAFPTVTLIEVDALIAQVQRIIEQVSRAVELVLYLVVAAAGLVLVASIQASRDARMAEHALLRTLGGTRRLIRGALAAEFMLLGAGAGLLAAAGAELVLALLQRAVFELPVILHPWVWLAGPVIGALLVGTLGLITTRRLISAPPMAVLRGLV